MNDIDYTKGFDEEMVTSEAPTEQENTIAFPKSKRAPYVIWSVSGQEFKLKLTAIDITKLEQRYRRNLLLYLTDDGIPAVADMLTVIQASMRLYNQYRS